MKKLLALAAMVLSLAFSPAALAKDKPETDEERFVRLTKLLESQPLSDTDKSIRTWLIQWASDSQDVHVLVCDVLGAGFGNELPHMGIYVSQLIFGNAAHQISHPEKKDDLLATQLAGARSALKAYRSIVSSQPEARIPQFDRLLEKEDAGALESHLAPIVAEKCGNTDGTDPTSDPRPSAPPAAVGSADTPQSD